jgi:hypothetical protein
MGCDIRSYVEIRNGDQWEPSPGEVFDCRDYGLFGFLADVRNYSHSPVIAEPRGLPDDVSPEMRTECDEWGDCHSTSWLTLAELLAYDYDQVFWDRRVTKGNNGAALADEGEGRHLPLREFLGPWYFGQLDELTRLGDPSSVRIVFWFDS